MEMRKLGGEGLRVSAVGLGCMGMSTAYAGAGDEESRATIQAAVEAGVTLFDTADVYGPHTNEVLVGAELGPHRDRVTIATKFGNETLPDGTGRINGRPGYVRAAVDGSLSRLGLEVIDLYYQHRVDPGVPIEETVGAMAELVAAGKVRFLGLSEASAITIRRAHAVHPISALQSEYSLWTRDPEDGVIATVRELGIGLVPYSPLGRGFLTGRFRSRGDIADGDYRRGNPRFSDGNLEHNLALVHLVDGIADDKGCSAAQVALAWLLAQGPDIVPIPGTTRRRNLADNLGALDVRLSDAELARLSDAVEAHGVAGGRMDEAGLSKVNL